MKKEFNNSNEIAIVVLSFDGFKELWKPFFDYFFKAWNDCPYKIYLLNNFQKYDDERITNLLVGEDVSWSDSLKKGLEKIAEKRVFFLYDDAFIYQLDKSEITNCFQTAITNDYTSVMLRPFTEDFLDGKTLDYVKKQTGLDFLVIKDCYSTKEIVNFVNGKLYKKQFNF